MLQNIPLQGIAESAEGFFDALSSGVGTFAIILLVAVLGFGALIAIIMFRRKFDFEGTGEPIGRMKIEIMGKYTLEGNVAEWEMIDQEKLDLLKDHDDLKIVPDIIKQLYKEKSLFIYTMKNPDDSDILEKFGSKVYIISSGDFKSDLYSYKSTKGKFTWRHLFSKEETRTIIAYSSAKKLQILNEDRNLDDWWILSPMPMVAPTNPIGFNSKAIGEMMHHIEIKEIINPKGLASAISFIPFVTDALSKNDYLKKELFETQKSRDDIMQKYLQVNQKLQKKKRQLGQKPYVVRGKQEETTKEKQNAMMAIVAVVLGAMSVMFIPNFLQNMPIQSAQFVGMIIAVIAIGGIIYMQNKQKPKEEVEVDHN